MSSIRSIGEHALVERLRTRIGSSPQYVTLGVGDDAAVLAPERGQHDVVTTDALVEHVHFRRDWTAPQAIGHKALAINLSDLASMGATPRASLLSLVLPDDFPLADFDALVHGFVSLASQSGAALIGGNLSRSPGPVIVDVTAIGSVRPRRMLRRSGARPNDELYVTGHLGAAATGLALLAAGTSRDGLDDDRRACVDRYERPDARVRCGRIVARTGAAAVCIDLSDGLADGARRLAAAAGIGVVVEAPQIPVHPAARAWAIDAGRDPLELALTGGEDYELAFAVRPRQRSKFLAALRRCGNLPTARVGRFVAEPGAWLEQDGERQSLKEGFTHF